MNFIFRTLLSLVFMATYSNHYFYPETVSFVLAIAVLVASAYSLWIFLQDRKQIRIMLRPGRMSPVELTGLIIVSIVIIGLVVVEFNGVKLFPVVSDYNRLQVLYYFLFANVSFFTSILLIAYLKNPSPFNRESYMNSYIFLESGLKMKGLQTKIYPWNDFVSFEVLLSDRSIILVFRNGQTLSVKVNRHDLESHFPAIEIFLLEKIPSTNKPVSM